MASIKIGGTDIEVPELNLKALKKVFPIVKEMQLAGASIQNMDPETAMKALDDTVKIISIALERSTHPMTPEKIEDALLVSEIPGLEPALLEVLKLSGLHVKAPGEPVPVEEEVALVSASTGTSTQSSAKSSLDAEVRTGS